MRRELDLKYITSKVRILYEVTKKKITMMISNNIEEKEEERERCPKDRIRN